MDHLSQFPFLPLLGSVLTGKPNLFSVSYDLRVHGQDYYGLTKQLEKMNAIRVQQSLWLVTSYASNSVALRDQLLSFIDGNDSLLVTRVVDISGWEGDPQVRAWIGMVVDASILSQAA